MKRGGGKRKGAGFERKVCMHLSRLIKPGTDETLFWRSAMSGGRATIRHRKLKSSQGMVDSSQAGDITCIHPDGAWFTEKFFVECKFHKSLAIQAAFLDGRGSLSKFWHIVGKQAKSHYKEPMLIAKENFCNRILLIMTPQGKRLLETFGYGARILLRSEVLGVYVMDYESLSRLKR